MRTLRATERLVPVSAKALKKPKSIKPAKPQKTTAPRKSVKARKPRKASAPVGVFARLSAHRLLIGRGAVALTVFATIMGGFVWAQKSDLSGRLEAAYDAAISEAVGLSGLTLDEVIVVGRHETALKDISRALGVRRSDAILSLDLDEARQRLEKLGWVRQVTVTRRLPGNIHVHLLERRPFALWQNQRKLVLIDRDGVVITDRKLARFSALPVIVGRDAPLHAATLFDDLARRPKIFQRVVAAVRIASRRWDVRFKNGVIVRLPEENLAQSWDRLAALEIEHAILERDIKSIDLRLIDRLTVRLGEEAAKRRNNTRTGKGRRKGENT